MRGASRPGSRARGGRRRRSESVVHPVRVSCSTSNPIVASSGRLARGASIGPLRYTLRAETDERGGQLWREGHRRTVGRFRLQPDDARRSAEVVDPLPHGRGLAPSGRCDDGLDPSSAAGIKLRGEAGAGRSARRRPAGAAVPGRGRAPSRGPAAAAVALLIADAVYLSRAPGVAAARRRPSIPSRSLGPSGDGAAPASGIGGCDAEHVIAVATICPPPSSLSMSIPYRLGPNQNSPARANRAGE